VKNRPVTVVYIVNLLFSSWKLLIMKNCANQGKARSDMTVEERIAAADRRKTEGNEYFREKKLEEAMQQYEMVSGVLYFLHDDSYRDTPTTFSYRQLRIWEMISCFSCSESTETWPWL
jgi:hypothetical protein